MGFAFRRNGVFLALSLVIAPGLALFAFAADIPPVPAAALVPEKATALDVDSNGQFQVTRGNFLNTGLKLSAGGKYGEDKRIKAGLRKNHVFGTGWFAGAQVQGVWDDDPGYMMKGMIRGVYAGKKLAPALTLTVRFENKALEVYGITADSEDIMLIRGNNNVSILSAVLEHSTVDSKSYPRNGAVNTLEFGHSGPCLGSDYLFNRLTWQFKKYITPGKTFTFAFRSKAGWVDGKNGVPLFERFFAGGREAVRGYEGKMLGPRDGLGFPKGGRLLALQTLEARVPVGKRLYAAAFFDAGGLWREPEDLRLKDLRFGTGLGLRYITPWGTARIDYGIRIGHDADLPRSRLYVGFGTSF